MKKIALQILLVVAGLIPLWIFLIVHAMINPAANGFWAEVVITGLGIYFLGGLQIVGVVIIIMGSVEIWTN